MGTRDQPGSPNTVVLARHSPLGPHSPSGPPLATVLLNQLQVMMILA